MRTAKWWVITLAFLPSCSASPEDSPGAGGASAGGTTGGAAPSANGGSAPAGGSSSAGSPSGGTMGGVSNGMGGGLSAGTTSAGMPNNAGAGAAGAPAGGNSPGGSANAGRDGAGRGGAAGSAGRPSGGGGKGGTAVSGAGGAVTGGTGGAVTGGSGGSGACVKNLGCKLSPPPSTGDLHQDCVDRINQFRTQCACLPPLARRLDGEACADQMAEYDAGKNDAHAGLSDDICQPGGSQNSCPGYSSNNQVISLCLQQMWDEGPPPMTPCTGDCFQEYGHFINMTSTTVTRVACGFYTTAAGKVWSVQNFTR